jgi:hypothetical protein
MLKGVTKSYLRSEFPTTTPKQLAINEMDIGVMISMLATLAWIFLIIGVDCQSLLSNLVAD